MMDLEKFQQYEHTLCDENCVDCKHRGVFTTSTVNTILNCDYIGDFGHPRPCEAGKNCTVKEVGNPNRRFAII